MSSSEGGDVASGQPPIIPNGAVVSVRTNRQATGIWPRSARNFDLTSGQPIHFSATAVDMVRGVLATCPCFPARPWRRSTSGSCTGRPTARNRSSGSSRREKEYIAIRNPSCCGGRTIAISASRPIADTGRVVVIAAIDNLMKGSGGTGGAVPQPHVRIPRNHGAGISGPPSGLIMCRLLAIAVPYAHRCGSTISMHSRASAVTSREYQGHGWGCAVWRGDAWDRLSDRISRSGKTTSVSAGQVHLLLAHARSAFRDEDIVVENNMPFIDGAQAFVFNGETARRSVTVEGRIGAARLFRFLRSFCPGRECRGNRTCDRDPAAAYIAYPGMQFRRGRRRSMSSYIRCSTGNRSTSPCT